MLQHQLFTKWLKGHPITIYFFPDIICGNFPSFINDLKWTDTRTCPSFQIPHDWRKITFCTLTQKIFPYRTKNILNGLLFCFICQGIEIKEMRIDYTTKTVLPSDVMIWCWFNNWNNYFNYYGCNRNNILHYCSIQ